MDDAKPPFEQLLRQATGHDGAGPLFAALGFGPKATPVPPPSWSGFGLEDAECVRAFSRAGERGAAGALLVECSAAPTARRVLRLARRVRAHDPARLHLFVFAGPEWRRLVFVSFGLDGEPRRLELERRSPRPSDIEALAELAARPGERGTMLAARHARALDRSRMTRRFFRDFRAARERVAGAWTGAPEDAADERGRLALLFLCRLMFLYFLQRPGHLAGDVRFLPNLFRAWRRRPDPAGGQTFYRERLVPLFFGALNRRPGARAERARALGALPYLNGGLFERHALERRQEELDLPDEVVGAVFDELLERYRFTARESAEAAAEGDGTLGIDPEMLGRVFEGLMAPDRRGRTGTFYTPAPVVDRVAREAVATYAAGREGTSTEQARALVRRGEASRIEPAERKVLARELADLRVLDPACGSGAFLLGALSRLSRVRAALEDRAPGEFRREIVAHTLHGVDIQDDAALICALRLWLALAVGGSAAEKEQPVGLPEVGSAPPPLPNLDRKIRQGDALVDPLDLVAAGAGGDGWREAAADADVRRALRRIRPLSARYLSAEPEERRALQRELAGAEQALARSWLEVLGRRFAARLAELEAAAEARDLFDERPAAAKRAARARERLRQRESERERLRGELEEQRALPFFSFPVHFAGAAEAGFDLVLSNPPWVRAHRWPGSVGGMVRERYAVSRAAGWRRGAELAGAPGGAGAQVDLSLLFLERSLRLLVPGGVLGMLVPAKALRSLYGAGARRLLLEGSRLALLEDHALDQRAIFGADSFAAAIVARKHSPEEASDDGGPRAVRVTLTRRDVEPLRFRMRPDELPVVPGDADAPWLLAPPDVQAALRRMQAAGPPLGDRESLSVRRGVMTGANNVLAIREAKPKLGGLARIRAEGYFRGASEREPRHYEAFVESDALRPLVRGSGIAAWNYETSGHLLWTHDDTTTEPLPDPPPRAARYLARHSSRLRARSGWRPGRPEGALFRLRPDTLAPKVAWHDLAETLKAVALPAEIRSLGAERALVPLNTVYYIPIDDPPRAELLAAYLNSLPVRTFARAVAERAKDARFRFLAWTVALVPLPEDWASGPAAERLLTLSRAAHRRGAITPDERAELDTTVAASYGLTDEHTGALAAFDRWLRGE